jgi:hypothetical protein
MLSRVVMSIKVMLTDQDQYAPCNYTNQSTDIGGMPALLASFIPSTAIVKGEKFSRIFSKY